MKKVLSCEKNKQQTFENKEQVPMLSCLLRDRERCQLAPQASDSLAQGTGAKSPERCHTRCSPVTPGSQGVTPQAQQTDPSQGL